MFLRFLLSVALLIPGIAGAASIEFVTVTYDPDGADQGAEWVRVQNVSSVPLDFALWRFYEGGVNHKLRALAGTVVPASGFAVIADDGERYVVEHPHSTDTIFDSSFSLSNTGETVALKNASSTVMAETTYTAIPKPKSVATTKPATRTAAKKSEPRLLQKGTTTVVTANVGESVPSTSHGLWPWLLAVLALGAVAGVGLVWVRERKSEAGYSIIDISEKK